MTRIAIVGPGAVGGFFAAHLAAVGHDVLSCARRPFDRYVVESDELPVDVAARVVIEPEAVDGHADWVLVGVKAHQTAAAAPWLDRLCGPGSTVVVLQNGVEGVARLSPLAHGAEVIPTVVYCGTELLAPGHIRHRRGRTLIVPERPSSHRFAALFERSPARVEVTSSYVTEAWRKLGTNVATNGITALTGRSLMVLREPGMPELVVRILEECWAVARAEGASLGPEDVSALVDRLTAGLRGGTSMLYDRRAGHPTEHDALYGAVIRAGSRHGIPTPFAETMAALIAAGDQRDGAREDDAETDRPGRS